MHLNKISVWSELQLGFRNLFLTIKQTSPSVLHLTYFKRELRTSIIWIVIVFPNKLAELLFNSKNLFRKLTFIDCVISCCMNSYWIGNFLDNSIAQKKGNWKIIYYLLLWAISPLSLNININMQICTSSGQCQSGRMAFPHWQQNWPLSPRGTLNSP